MLKVTQLICVLIFSLAATVSAAEKPYIVFEPRPGPGNGKHVVFLAGDEEYRSEEALPMLAQVLSQRHGFKATVLFSVNADGTINPDKQDSLSHSVALDTADVIVMALRFRKWPDADMKRFVEAYQRGVPIVALRTSTHAFQFPGGSTYAEFSKFGKRVLGEEWVTHWGRHKVEATRGIVEPGAEGHSVLRGVKDVFGDTDVYEAYPPSDAKILMRGQVLKGMNPNDPPAAYSKKRASDGKEQDVNDPMMPVAWTREFKNEAGKVNRIFCTTLGSATDLASEDFRRMVVNSVFWGLKMDVPQRADVRPVGEFNPTMYGFGTYKKGVKPSDYALPAGGERPAASLKLNPGDHIAILGNALPDRMQHSGYFEAFIHARHPDHNLVVRNLAAAGDEVSTWFRSENFGSRDDWLGRARADVILAFYGYSESFKGPEGVEKFKADLEKFLKETSSKNYSGKGAPRIVLFSPIAGEKHPDPNFPDPAARNRNLALYTSAMETVARAQGVQFVNLFEPSQKLYEEARQRGQALTVNGHYLTDAGDQHLAFPMFQAVFGTHVPYGNWEKLRNVVNEKNWQWHQRYRTVDGYNVYGGRSALAFQAGKSGFISNRHPPEPHISNYKVMQEEMSQRDVLTGNRDHRVWAVSRGGDLFVDDSNLPTVTQVVPNQPGPNPDGTYPMVSGEEAMHKMTLHSGMKINLFADEKQFPELINPVQMAWDTRGRLWVAVWPNYPERTPTSTKGDSLLIFEDTNGDGRADKMTTFIEDLNAPTGFQFYQDGVLLMQAPDLWFLRDTNGDGRADWKELVLMGMDSADSHHTANAICLDPGGAIYLSDGVFHRTQVETVSGVVRNVDAAIYRFDPRTAQFETHIAYGFANPHGRVFDRWGNDLVTDATGNNTYFGPAFSGWLDFEKGKHSSMKQFWERPSRPCPATGILSSRHFPDEFQDNFLNLNVIGFLGIFRVGVSEEGAGLKGETLEHLIHSTDPNFRPIDLKMGPDGAIYFADWHNPIIGHMQHHLRDPSRDADHGRIYRITYEGRPLLEPARIHGQPIAALLDLLKEPENQTRELAKVELGNHDSERVVAEVKSWISRLDRNASAYEHHMMEALWVHQWHNVVNADLLQRMLKSPDHRARAAAGRVLCYWRDHIPNALALFRTLAGDEHPRVRLEAVRAASFYRTAEAADMALLVLKRPMDYYLEYTLKETLRQLDSYWRGALAEGKPVGAGTPGGVERLIANLRTSELENLPPTAPVLNAILARADATDAMRMLALDALAEQRGTTRTVELVKLMGATSGEDVLKNLSRLLPLLPAEELAASRAQIQELATQSASSAIRRAAWAAVALADDSFEKVWRDASQPARYIDAVGAISLIVDSEFRGKTYDQVKPLLTSYPPAFQNAEAGQKGALRRAAIQAMVSIPREQNATFAALARLVAGGDEVVAAAQGMRTLPLAAWGKADAAVAAPALVAWARQVPAAERTSQDYVETVQLAGDLAGLLPSERATALRADLRALRVDVFVVRAVREEMRYDTPRLVVEAGKSFEIIFENPDFMPHNLVIVKPGTREKVGAVAETMSPEALDNRRRAYVPNMPEVIAATAMLEGGQRATLKMAAPAEEGEYEYVCTFPGHWQVMWGKLMVVRDVDAYLESNPEMAQPVAHGHHQHHSSLE